MKQLPFERFVLKNGLKLIIHRDTTTPLVACNVVYKVGSKDEVPDHTGIAHLFEHFMFCGSKNIENYDLHLQKIGATNNAYTIQDLTHYYIILPANNLETALWLESDRMLELSFDEEQLNIQKHVVIEEFKEHYINRPFGNLWHYFNSLIYREHPYQWLPIGKDIKHIETVDMAMMKSFFYRFYRPDNAVLTIAGNVDTDKTVALVEKWFADIPAGGHAPRMYPEEPLPASPKTLTVRETVPYPVLLKGWLMPARLHPDFHAFDLLSDLFGNGKSAYLHRELVEKKQVFSSISAMISATFDMGYWVIAGTPVQNMPIEKANEILSQYLYHFQYDNHLAHDLQKVKNRAETLLLTNIIKLEDRASTLSVEEALSKIEDYEHEKEHYFAVTETRLKELTPLLLDEQKCHTLFYKSEP
ncbi:MAG: insulinase family protein [Bacteroidales bacterium]|jgi:predicted Zn-dependent peptidase|nr:insulinase family protein [Bacteroidales bacterium]